MDNKRLHQFINSHKLPAPVYVTQPSMPPLADFVTALEKIWNSKWLTNQGPYHQQLEQKLGQFLGTPHLNLFNNGTIALMVAIHALRLHGEVITTPFTFPATPNVLYWNHITPVFCDIEEKTFNIDPYKIEELITPHTTAIMPVHVYGNPCEVELLEKIAQRHGLRLIYDAAHAFGVVLNGRSLAAYGDMSMVSFHATKLFSTLEGGALVVKDQILKERVDSLKNFGIANEEVVLAPGINGKMNEVQAAFGLLHLQMVKDEVTNRQKIAALYRSLLANINGITCLHDLPGVEHNYAYFPILVDEKTYGLSRDQLHTLLKEFQITTRKYFHPLCTHYPFYRALPSANPHVLPVAERVASQVLCLPIYGTLALDVVRVVSCVIQELPSLQL